MPETLTAIAPPSSPEKRTPLLDQAEIARLHEQIRQTTERLLAALVLSYTLEAHSLDHIAKAHPPETTSQTNRERWEDFLHKYAYSDNPANSRRYDSPDDFENSQNTYQSDRFTGNFGRPTTDYQTFGQPFGRTEAPRTESPYTKYDRYDNYGFDAGQTTFDASDRAQTPPKTESAKPKITLPFEIFPAGMRPNNTEKAGAARANEVMRSRLEEQGWTGGKPTEQQLKKATQAALRDLHTDTGDRSAVDQEAAKLISGQMSEITTKLFGEKPNEAPEPEAGTAPKAEPQEPKAEAAAETTEQPVADVPKEIGHKTPLAIASATAPTESQEHTTSEH